jgi:two-component system, chemotaxis family, protein-glutamate methylesterase/glutaminase
MGGSVIASDRSTSTVFAMPYATISRDEIIDHVVPVSEIAVMLAKLLGQPDAGAVAPAQDSAGNC